jgi:hypothetical protein
MTKDTKSKGIHDPWRMGTPEWEPPPNKAPAGTKGSKLPFDWDLQPDKVYVLRHRGVSIKIIGADEPVGAAAVLINAFNQDQKVNQILAAAGFEYHDDGGGSGFTLKVREHTLACPAAVDARDGMNRLCQALRRAIRADHSMKERLRKLGVVPLIS